MLQSIAAPYGTARSASQARRLRYADVRASETDSRLIWRDRLELVQGQYVLRSRRWSDEVATIESVPLDQIPIECSHMSWKTPAAFDARSSSSEAWRAVHASDVMIEPAELLPRAEVDNVLRSLGLPECLDLNPLLEGRLGGKRLLIPALSLVLAVTAPSHAVFASLMHPLDTKFYAVRSINGSVRLRSVGRLRVCDFGDRDLACLAYWLRDGRTTADEALLAAVVGRAPLRSPQAPGVFRFVIEGYENDDTIVVRRLGQLRSHQCWPVDWEEASLIDERGSVASRLLPLPGGLLSRVHRPLQSSIPSRTLRS